MEDDYDDFEDDGFGEESRYAISDDVLMGSSLSNAYHGGMNLESVLSTFEMVTEPDILIDNDPFVSFDIAVDAAIQLNSLVRLYYSKSDEPELSVDM